MHGLKGDPLLRSWPISWFVPEWGQETSRKKGENRKGDHEARQEDPHRGITFTSGQLHEGVQRRGGQAHLGRGEKEAEQDTAPDHLPVIQSVAG